MNSEPPLENAPLLQRRESPMGQRLQAQRRTRLVLLSFVIVGGMTGNFAEFPNFYLVQQTICFERLHGETNMEICMQDNDVQASVARMLGLIEVFCLIPIFLTTFLYGKLADSWGRKPVLLLTSFGGGMAMFWVPVVNYLIVDLKLAFLDSRAFCFMGVWMFLGGGYAVVNSMLHTIIADIFPAEDRFREFSYLSAAAILPLFIAQPFSTWLNMTYGKWIPYVAMVPLMAVEVFLVLALPETIHPKLDVSATETNLSILSHLDYLTVPILISVFFTDTGARISGSLLISFCTKVLGWSLQATSFLPSANASVSMVVSAVILPILLNRFQKISSNARETNLMIILFCTFLCVLGNLLKGMIITSISFVIGLLLHTFGLGISNALRALAALYIPQDLRGQFYSLISVLDVTGNILSSLVSPNLFTIGLKRGGLWRGLMYDISAMLSVLALVVLIAKDIKLWVRHMLWKQSSIEQI